MSDQQVSIKVGVQGINDVKAALSQLQNGFSAFKAALSAPVVGVVSLSAITAGIVHFTRSAIESADQMGKLAQRTGMSVQELSGLAYAGKLADVSMDDIRLAMKGLSVEMEKTGRGGESVIKELLRISDAFKQMPDGATKTAYAIQFFGKSGQSLIPLLNQGSAAIREQVAEAERLGLVIGPEFAERAARFNENITRIKSISEGFFLKLADAVLPKMVEHMSGFVDQLVKLDPQSTIIETLAKSFDVLGQSIQGVAIVARGMIALELEAAEGSTWDKIKNAIVMSNPITGLLAATNKAVDLSFGEMIAEAIRKNIVKPLAEAVLQSKELERLGALRQDLVKTREALDLEAAKRKLMTDQQKFDFLTSTKAKAIPSTAEITSLRSSVEQERKPIEDRRDATQLAFDEGAISKQDFDKFEVHDKNALLGNKQALDAIRNPNSLKENMTDTLKSLQKEFGSTAQIISRGFSSVIGSAVTSVSQGIRGLIDGTMTWGKALQTIGGGILNGIIDAIAEMVAKFVVGQIVMRGAMLATHLYSLALQAKAMIISAAQAVVAFVKWLPAAIASSIGSWGTAAVIGAAAVVAGLAAAGAFAEGGYTGSGGKYEPAGIVHRGEFVMSADAVNRIGLPTLEALHSGDPMPAGVPQTQKPFRFHFVNGQDEVRRIARSDPGFEDIIVDIYGRNVHRFKA